MTTDETRELFDRHDGEFLMFDRIPAYARKHARPDLCAMLYLHDRFGGTGNAITQAEHDEIWLAYDDVSGIGLTEEDVIYLARCGVRYDDHNDSFALFV